MRIALVTSMPELSHSNWRARRYRSAVDYVCGQAPPWLTEVAQSLLRAAMMERIGRHVGNQAFDHALDLACAVGDWTTGYLEFARQATGVDINEDFVGVARRRAAVLGVEDRARFEVGTLETFAIPEGTDFVGLGGCMMYLSDVEANRVLGRVRSSLPTRGLVYVRSTVASPLHARHETGIGVYRELDEYETLFRANGLRVVDRAFSSAVVAEHLAAPVSSARLRALAVHTAVIVCRAERALRRPTDFCNWLLRPAA